MTRPGRGAAGSPPGRGRGPKGAPGRDEKSGPGAARASGRHTGNPPRPSTPPRSGKDRGGSRRTGRGGTVPPPRKTGAGKQPESKATAPAKTGRTAPAPKKAAGPKGGESAKSPKGSKNGTRPADGRRARRPGPGAGAGGRRPPPRRPARQRVPFHRRDPMKRLNVGLLVVAFVLSLFAGRLVQLQTIESGKYTELAMEQRLQDIVLPAVRGDITDAQGNPLAMTVEARAIFADPYVIKPEKRQAIVTALAPILGLPPAEVMRGISKPKSRFVYLAHGVPPDKARLVTALKFLGIGTLPEYRRDYPNDALAADVIGFVNRAGNGAAGLESALNKQLAGRNGAQKVEISPDGQHIPMGEDQKRPSVPGRGLRLTLLRDLQSKAQQEIEAQVRATQARNGSVIVMDPRTGEILAMASAPGFDPNNYAKSPPGTWGNPIVQEAFEPGSTGKVVTAAAAMEQGGVRPETEFVVPYSIRRSDRVFHDSHPHPTRRLTFAGVLATSSNVGTIQASERITQDTLYRYLRAFGFGEKTGVGLPAETAGQLNPPAKWSGTDRYPIAFGQTVSVNALQMASVYATLANGGVRVTPQLIAGTIGEDKSFTAAPAPRQKRVISAETARQIRDMLEGVTTAEGTAPKARIPGYRVAGKTGTAEIVNPNCGCYTGGGFTASFAGFAPADDPQLVVQVVLQAPKRGSHYGGDVAAPVFKDVMSFALQTRKVPPTGSKAPTIRIYARD
ncbi:peptidoglycan D,D-transpeptidase FtsI family protein [Spirillospora sp. NPDC048911]|uniref:peptidoglycan D,D-transpeptidase FtsI family protein n=1 Tax=Spirillospora sp. NPDC048911 TaxID=3364527 RepID=UPI0037230430